MEKREIKKEKNRFRIGTVLALAVLLGVMAAGCGAASKNTRSEERRVGKGC